MSLIPFMLDLADDLEQLELDNTRISIGHWPQELEAKPRRIPNLEFGQKSPKYHRRHRNHHQEREKLTKSDGYQVSVNIEEFDPSEVTVKTVNHSIVVEAKQEEREEGRSAAKHFVREYNVPEICDIRDVVSTLSSDGTLTVRVPYKDKIEDHEILEIEQMNLAHEKHVKDNKKRH